MADTVWSSIPSGWTAYTPPGCKWTKPFSSGTGTCIVEFQLWYKWGTPDTSKRNVKLESKLILHLYAYDLDIGSNGATRNNGYNGFNLGISIGSDSLIKRTTSIVNTNQGWNQASSGHHYVSLISTFQTMKFNDSGNVTGKINYDLYMKWYSINQGSLKSIDSVGVYTIPSSNTPTIPGTAITSITLSNSTLKTFVRPNKIQFTNVSTTSVSVDSGKTITLNAKIAGYSTTDNSVKFSVKPTAATGTINLTSSNNSIIVPKVNSVDVTKTNTFTVTSKTPGTANITLKSNSNKTATLNCTVSANNGISWTSSNTSVATVNNGVITTKTGVNGTTTIKATSVSNSVTSNSIITNVLLPPNTIVITPNKSEIYPGESVKYQITLNPYVAGNSAKCVASTYRGMRYYVEAHGDFVNPVPLTANNSSTSLEVNYVYTFNNYVVPTKEVVLKTTSIYNSAINADNTLIVKTPTLDVDKTGLVVDKDGNTKTVTVSTMPINSNFSYTYDSNYITVTRNNNILTIKGKEETTEPIPLKITGTMPIISGIMTAPTKTVNVSVGTVPITDLSFESNSLTQVLNPSGVTFTEEYNPTAIYSDTSSYEVKNSFESYDNTDSYINTLIGYQSTMKSVDINYLPIYASDNIYVEALSYDNPEEESDVVSIDPRSKNIFVDNGNGSKTITMYCMKPGKAYIQISNESETVIKRVPIEVTFDNGVILSTGNSSIVTIKNFPTQKANNSAQYLSTTNEFNGSTIITVKSNSTLSQKSYSATFNSILRPKNITVSTNVKEVYPKDKINISILQTPYDRTRSDKTISSNLRRYTILFVTENGTIFDRIISDSCSYEFTYTIPDSNIFSLENTRRFNIIVYNNFFDDVRDEVTIEFKRTTIDLDGSNKTADLYLGNTPISNKTYIVTANPELNYILEDNISGSSINETGGYLPTTQEEGKKLTVTGTSYRNLTINGQPADREDCVYTAGDYGEWRFKGRTLSVIYNGKLIGTEIRPKVNVNIYTGLYFGIPKVLNVNVNNTLIYYGTYPRIFIQLPDYNDFDMLQDIEVKLSNGVTYSFERDATCFSVAYNPNKHLHYSLSSAIVDYGLEGHAYLEFLSPVSIQSGSATITYKSKYSTIPDSSIQIKIVKQPLPILPEIGEVIKRDNVVRFIKAVENIISPFYLTKNSNNLFKPSSMIDVMYGVTATDPNSIGIIGDKIRAMPFFKVLYTIQTFIDRLNTGICYISAINLPDRFKITTNVRNMLVADEYRIEWYNKYVRNNPEGRDKKLYDDCLRNGLNLLDPISTETYPIMVDDSNDYIGNPIYNVENIYKNSPLYDKYTISPLTEIKKFLEQF